MTGPTPTPYYDPSAPQQTPGRKRLPTKAKVWLTVVAIVVAVVCAFGTILVGNVAKNVSDSTSPSPTAPTVPTTRPTKPPTKAPDAAAPVKKAAPAPATIDEGVWQVGTDVKAGRYRLDVAPEEGCYWEISKDDAGNDIVSNDLPTGGHPQVTLKKGQFFKTNGCGVWTKIH